MYLRSDLREIPSSLAASAMLLCPTRTAGKIRAKRLFRPLRSITLGLPIRLPCRLALYADDLPQKLKEVQNVGGQIVKPIYQFPGGQRFHFLDPNGIELAVWSE